MSCGVYNVVHYRSFNLNLLFFFAEFYLFCEIFDFFENSLSSPITRLESSPISRFSRSLLTFDYRNGKLSCMVVGELDQIFRKAHDFIFQDETSKAMRAVQPGEATIPVVLLRLRGRRMQVQGVQASR